MAGLLRATSSIDCYVHLRHQHGTAENLTHNRRRARSACATFLVSLLYAGPELLYVCLSAGRKVMVMVMVMIALPGLKWQSPLGHLALGRPFYIVRMIDH